MTFKPSPGHLDQDAKKPKRSGANQADSTTSVFSEPSLASSAAIRNESMITQPDKGTLSPPHNGRAVANTDAQPQFRIDNINSPPPDTQELSQFVNPIQSISHEVEDEEAEGVWGYLIPIGFSQHQEAVVLKKRDKCGVVLPTRRSRRKGTPVISQDNTIENESPQERPRPRGSPSSGYIIGRHPECGKSTEAYSHTLF